MEDFVCEKNSNERKEHIKFLPSEYKWGKSDINCNILHVDMDCFFAACEEKSNPHIVGMPVIVGGVSDRSVVSTANYQARKFGIHCAMPIKQAQVLCPKGIFLQPRIEYYKKISNQIFAIFNTYSDKVEPLSIDEAFIDVSSVQRIFGSPLEIAARIRSEIYSKTGLSASVGIAENMFLAKIASSMAKPCNTLLISRENSMKFLNTLSVKAIWGLGKKNQSILAKKGVETVSELSKLSPDALCHMLGGALGNKVYELSHGIDRRSVGEHKKDKSISNEKTFEKDVYDFETLRKNIFKLVKKSAFTARNKGLLGRTFSIKIKFADFTSITRDKTLQIATSDDCIIFETILSLLEKIDYKKAGIRLLGVKISNFSAISKGVEQVLFEDINDIDSHSLQKKNFLLKASDDIKKKFGDKIIFPACMIDSE